MNPRGAPTTDLSNSPVPRVTNDTDPAAVRYSLKVGLCIVLCYIIGLISRRPDLFTNLVTVIAIATPTYGATLHKMYLRISGFVIGGVVSLLAIITVSPNFETLPSYMLAAFAVFYSFAYFSLGNGRTSYAGKQMGVIFSLVFIGLSPSVDIYEPLWRIWGVLLADFVVAMVFFTLWPEYAGDSLLPRLQKSHCQYARASAGRLSFEQRGSNPEDELGNDARAYRVPRDCR